MVDLNSRSSIFGGKVSSGNYESRVEPTTDTTVYVFVCVCVCFGEELEVGDRR